MNYTRTERKRSSRTQDKIPSDGQEGRAVDIVETTSVYTTMLRWVGTHLLKSD